MHNTGNPLGSTSLLDLYDNAENIDYFANSQQDEVPDRFGVKRLTLAGLIKRSMALRNEINDFSGVLTFKPEWTDVPMNVSEGVGGEGGALNLQAEALGNRSEINKITSREALRRTYLEVGLNLVEGSFETGFTLVDIFDVVLQEATSKVFSGNPGVYLPNTDTTNFTDKSHVSSVFVNNSTVLHMLPGRDVTSEFKKAQDEPKPLYMMAGKYLITSPVEIKNDLIAVGGRVIFEMADLPAGAVAVTSNGEHDVIGLDIDCARSPNVQSGFLQNLDFEPTKVLNLDVVTRNVTNLNSSQGATGVLLVLNSNSKVRKVRTRAKIEAHNITGTPNGVIGDTGGSARGVMVSINPPGVEVDMVLDNLRVSSIYPLEDGDGIHIYDKDLDNLSSRSKYILKTPITMDCPKRGIKIQSPNTTVEDMVVHLDLKVPGTGSALALETLGVNTTLTNPVVNGQTNLTGDGSILVSAANFTMFNPQIKVVSGQNLIRMSNEAENHAVIGGGIRTTGTYPQNSYSMVTVEGNASGIIELDSVNVTTRTGCTIRYQGLTGRHSFSVKGLCQAETFAKIAYNNPKANIHLWMYQGDYAGKIIDKTGADGIVTVHNAFAFTSGTTIAQLQGNVNFIGTGELKGVENGIVYTGPGLGVEISGSWKIKCTAGTGIGLDIGGRIGCKVSGVETSGFDSGIHLNANYTEKCVVVNNIGRGTGTLVSSTGAKTLVNRDNDLIA
ncbi:MAG: hypothetical protein ACRCVV_11085 [Shewanella sp.]